MTETEPKTEQKGGILTDNGKGSFSRVSGLLIIVTFLIINIIHVLKAGEGILDLPMGWALTVLALYGFNKLADKAMDLLAKMFAARTAQ